MPIYSSLFPRALLNRLKIPWEQSRAGSSPVPSTLYTQLITSNYLLRQICQERKITHFLRTRPEYAGAMLAYEGGRDALLVPTPNSRQIFPQVRKKCEWSI